MNCPLCHHASSVIDSRPHGASIRRRRECNVCRHRWTTFEIDETRFKLAESVARALVEIQVEQL